MLWLKHPHKLPISSQAQTFPAPGSLLSSWGVIFTRENSESLGLVHAICNCQSSNLEGILKLFLSLGTCFMCIWSFTIFKSLSLTDLYILYYKTALNSKTRSLAYNGCSIKVIYLWFLPIFIPNYKSFEDQARQKKKETKKEKREGRKDGRKEGMKEGRKEIYLVLLEVYWFWCHLQRDKVMLYGWCLPPGRHRLSSLYPAHTEAGFS